MGNWSSFLITDVGNVRAVNEDDCLDRADQGVWVVADGMGGHEAGDFASATVTRCFSRGDFSQPLVDLVDEAERRLFVANAEVWEESERRGQTIGTTAVVLLARAQHCVFMWVGDSRLYRLRDGRLTLLTRDHTEYEEMIDEGGHSAEVLAEHSEVLTRAVGTESHLVVDMDYTEAQIGDLYLLCSDGLNKELTDAEVEVVMRSSDDPAHLAQALLGHALRRTGKDNVTVGVVRFR